MEFVKTKKYEIYIGLKDRATYEELFSIEDFVAILSALCVNKQIGFSMTKQFGGYTHQKGYVTENSIRITLLGIDKASVYALGDILKQRINTDTILITVEDCECVYA